MAEVEPPTDVDDFYGMSRFQWFFAAAIVYGTGSWEMYTRGGYQPNRTYFALTSFGFFLLAVFLFAAIKLGVRQALFSLPKAAFGAFYMLMMGLIVGAFATMMIENVSWVVRATPGGEVRESGDYPQRNSKQPLPPPSDVD